MADEKKRPEWACGGGKGFASHVMDGVEGGHDGIATYKTDKRAANPGAKRATLSIEDYEAGVRSANRMILARAISLVESNAHAHRKTAQELMKRLLPHTGKSVRIGITGVPGVGKSTFIEALGGYLLDRGKKLAVLAVDPSSSLTGGSILGDKTRMEKIGRHENCFIRPSPSGGTLGGVAAKTRETLLVCEAAGFDVIFVETVGVGQSEITVRSMVDFFLLLMLAGSGDELQGIKKGIMEIADGILINKADGDNKLPAEVARNEFERAIHYLQPATEGWQTRVYTVSAKTGYAISDVWTLIQEFVQKTGSTGVFDRRRKSQTRQWVHTMLEENLKSRFYTHPDVEKALPGIEKEVTEGELPATAAVSRLLEIYDKNR